MYRPSLPLGAQCSHLSQRFVQSSRVSGRGLSAFRPLPPFVRVDAPYISCATQRELPLTATRKSPAVACPYLLSGRPCSAPPYRFAQLFVRHLPEPRSQFINVQFCQLNRLHCCCSRRRAAVAAHSDQALEEQKHEDKKMACLQLFDLHPNLIKRTISKSSAQPYRAS
jgi:hypothetical protein